MKWCTVEVAAATIGIEERVLLDNAVLGGAPQAYGPLRRVEGSAYHVMLDLDDVKAWHAAGRPIADASYRTPAAPIAPKRPLGLVARLASALQRWLP